MQISKLQIEKSIAGLSNPTSFKLLMQIREKTFRLRDTGITPFLFNQWKEARIVDAPQLSQERKWVSLSFGEWLWIKVVVDLKKFGCSTEDILNTKANILISIGEAEIADDAKAALQEKVLKLLADSGEFRHEDIEEMKKELVNSNTNFLDLVKSKGPKPVNLLEATVLRMIALRNDASIVLYLADRVDEIKAVEKVLVSKRHKTKSSLTGFIYSDEIASFGDTSVFDSLSLVPHITIPLKAYIKEFILVEQNLKQVQSMDLLSKEELVLLSEFRKKNISELIVHYSKGKPSRIDVKEAITKAAEARIVDTFLKNEYANIEYAVENGQIVKFSKTKKIKL